MEIKPLVIDSSISRYLPSDSGNDHKPHMHYIVKSISKLPSNILVVIQP